MYGHLANSPARDALTVTKHDSNALTLKGGNPPSSIFVGTGGDVTLRMQDGAADVVWKVPTGGYILGAVTHIRSTGTTASDMLALYN